MFAHSCNVKEQLEPCFRRKAQGPRHNSAVHVKNLESLQALSGSHENLPHTLASKASSQNTRTVLTFSTHSSLLVSCLEPNDSSRGTS